MKSLSLVSLLSLILVAAATRGPTVIHAPSPSDDPQQEKGEERPGFNIPPNTPIIDDFGSLFPNIPTSRGEAEGNPRLPSIVDLLHSHMRNVHRQFPSFMFGNPFFKTSGVASEKPEENGNEYSPTGDECQGCQPWFGVFNKVFGNSFHRHLVPSFNTTLIQNLPPNYKNSTSHIHTEDGSKVVVNQTIHKESGDNFHHFYHVKVVHVMPFNETEENPENTKVPDVINTPENRGDTPFDNDEAANEVDLDNSIDGSKAYSQQLTKVAKRSVGDVSTGQEEIKFPPDHLNRFPHSVANRKDLLPVDDTEKVSRTWVYKDMGGKSYLYKISHDNNGVDKKRKTVTTNRDAETVGPIKPVDLSGDTRVNPDGSETQQGMTLTDPEAEVFNLTLVIKEAESRANSD